ncbi:unnamed protein product, partial [Cuscuta europaea]
MLALESEKNCRRMLKLEVTERLIEALDDRLLRANAARILRNLCAYSTGSSSFVQLQRLTASGPTILKAIMTEESKMQEVMLGLASHV